MEHHSSSVHGQPRRFRSMRDVSPIDENRKKLDAGPRTGSNIPVLRRAPAALQSGDQQDAPKQKFWEAKLAPNSKVKWDDYSGEPTSSSAGKAASVTPGTYAQGAAPGDRRPMGYQVSVSGPEKRNVSLSERMGRLGTKAPPVEPWSKATGRSEIAPPLKYDPTSKPLQLPRKALSPSAQRTDQGTSNALAGTMDHVSDAPDTHPVAAETHNLEMHNDLIKPIVPLKLGKKSPRSGLTSPTSPTNAGLGIHPYSYPSPITPTGLRSEQSSPVTVIDEPTEAALHPTQRTATPPYNSTESKAQEETPEKDKEAPLSRFSWTTYNSATTYQHSPPPSPPPPLPTAIPVPRQRVVTEPISAAASIISRRRPVPQSDRAPEPPAISHAATDSPGTAKVRTMLSSSPDPPSPSAASTFSTATTGTSKALPQPPTTLSAIDHIGILESQMEDLRIRRSNVYRVLTDLNNAAPSNPLITDFRRARMAEQRKRGFEDELSEIKREEHDVGLKLHRAWKKREREDPSTVSALWVRRVTS